MKDEIVNAFLLSFTDSGLLKVSQFIGLQKTAYNPIIVAESSPINRLVDKDLDTDLLILENLHVRFPETREDSCKTQSKSLENIVLMLYNRTI